MRLYAHRQGVYSKKSSLSSGVVAPIPQSNRAPVWRKQLSEGVLSLLPSSALLKITHYISFSMVIGDEMTPAAWNIGIYCFIVHKTKGGHLAGCWTLFL